MRVTRYEPRVHALITVDDDDPPVYLSRSLYLELNGATPDYQRYSIPDGIHLPGIVVLETMDDWIYYAWELRFEDQYPAWLLAQQEEP